MNSWVQASSLEQELTPQSSNFGVFESDNEPYSIFKKTPPERVGLNGEYDHSGLAKRVAVAFREEFAQGELAQVRITQRGRVVILFGIVSSCQILHQLVEVAIRINGTAAVETYGIEIGSVPQSEYL